MNGVLIIGASGHGKVVADILLAQGVHVTGFLDDDPATWGERRLGLPVWGSSDRFADFTPSGLVLAIGSNRRRRQVVERLGHRALHLWRNAIHPSSVVAPSAQLGKGIVVAASAVLNPDVRVGDHAIINTGATVDHDCVINSYAHIAPGTHLAGDVRVGVGALVGVGTAVHPSRSIGDWAVVGVGAVVVHDVPPAVVAKGVPARW